MTVLEHQQHREGGRRAAPGWKVTGLQGKRERERQRSQPRPYESLLVCPLVLTSAEASAQPSPARGRSLAALLVSLNTVWICSVICKLFSFLNKRTVF